jgi:hypothetical protein
MRKGFLLICYLLLFSTSCVDPFHVPGVSSNLGFLVAEGYINSGDGPTNITLSRTITLESEATKTPRELKAQVSVEGSDQSSFPLTEQGSGVYRHAHIPIDATKKYRLRIKTANAKEYLSEFVEVKRTPPIDSVIWNVDYEKRGVQFYVYSHDPNNSTHYYHWDVANTWQYHSYYHTSVEYKNGKVAQMNPFINLYDCWMTGVSSNIFVTSTIQLGQDVVYDFPLHFITSTSSMLNIGYSATVRQFAVTEEEYNYLHELKKSSEQQGSIFDAQPSTLVGNIKCISSPEEYALGYVGAHNSSEKNVFILSGNKLPAWFNGRTNDSINCPGTLPPASQIVAAMNNGIILPYTVDPIRWAAKSCIDCRVKGGTNIKPSYWPN